ncbi:transketolase family protein [Maledivibacter halophilus]|uniref:Transketolase subunit B n=1 Tax=Maledivibacter halophilus TaxID=36842 RepID=A0A1T5M8F1_9FIRM|nr:transketolase C-terminal domain-containing protein [Maledivibacter halophilus]SKC84521.1 transketolase subunit B [Maledivibacter halophilus]
MSWKLVEGRKEKEIRKAYGETLDELLQTHKDIVVCDADLASSSGAGFIYSKYPENSVNFGISEQNMISAGSGMSFVGIKPFVHSFAPFVSRRVTDQIFMSLGFAQGSMHIYASDPGYWSLYNGATHTTFEDLAIVRSIPSINVVAPSDATSFVWVLKYYAKHGGIFYNRAPRKVVPVIYEEGSTFEYGKGQWIKKGTDVVLIGEGPSVSDCLEAAKVLEGKGISTSVVDLLFIKPLDEKLIKEVVNSHKLVVTVENHNKYGGIGELIAGVMAQLPAKAPLRIIAVKDRFGEVGTKEYLKTIFNINIKDIVEIVLENRKILM